MQLENLEKRSRSITVKIKLFLSCCFYLFRSLFFAVRVRLILNIACLKYRFLFLV